MRSSTATPSSTPIPRPRRVALERAIADRATRLRGCVDVAEVFVASEQRSDRLTFETRTINRALQHDLVLYANAVANSELIFGWRSAERDGSGPGSMTAALAINWVAEWLAENVS